MPEEQGLIGLNKKKRQKRWRKLGGWLSDRVSAKGHEGECVYRTWKRCERKNSMNYYFYKINVHTVISCFSK